jgi:hypothetical protein
MTLQETHNPVMVDNSLCSMFHELSRLEDKTGRKNLTGSADSLIFALKIDRALRLIR